MVHVLIVFLFAIVGVASAEVTPLTAKQILQKMVKAMEVSTYQGTVVFLKNDKLEAMKYFHSIEKNREKERLVSLNSPQREIVRNSDEVSCLFKSTHNVAVEHRPYEHSFIVDVPKNLDEMDASYHFEIAGEEDIAMIPSYIVSIQPKDEFRYVRKIWIAKEQFLPTKAVVYDLSGVVLEQVVFTELQVNKGVHDQLSPPAAKAENFSQLSISETNDLPGLVSFALTTLPRGFKQIFFSRKPLHKSDQPVDHLLLSDGFASVSIYLETKKTDSSLDPRIPDGIHSVGAINSMSLTIADSQLTVLGEVPAATVKYIAEGIKLRNSDP